MSNEQAPECCPFCGAGIRIEKDGSQCRAPRGTWVGFNCCTTWHQGYHDQRRLQSLPCILAERERLTRERDGLRAAHTNALNQIGDLCMENTKLLARIKRLEEALEACAAIIGPRDKVTWATDEQVDHAWELYTKAKEATR